MLNQITFEQVKRNLISEKTQKRTNNPDVLAIFLSILVLYTNNMNQERNTDWYWETFIKHTEPLRWAVYFQFICVNLVPLIKVTPQCNFTLFVNKTSPSPFIFFFTFFSLPLSGPRRGGEALWKIFLKLLKH